MKDFLELSGNGIMYILTATQTKEFFQIVSLVLSVVISVLIIAEKIISWYKDAKKDGKITKNEIEDLGNNIKENIEDIVDAIQSQEEKENDND